MQALERLLMPQAIRKQDPDAAQSDARRAHAIQRAPSISRASAAAAPVPAAFRALFNHFSNRVETGVIPAFTFAILVP